MNLNNFESSNITSNEEIFSTPNKQRPKNIILLVTDQERAVQWFPENWIEDNLPGMNELMSNGVTFTNAFDSSAMCSPSRASIFTGLYPSSHGVTDTLTQLFTQSNSEQQLDPNLPNLATVLKSQGYDVVFKGKWHLSKGVTFKDPSSDKNIELFSDISKYGFDGWNPPDAGEDTQIKNYGGGTANNDQRYVDDAIEFLKERLNNPNSKPFCLVVSLVNPHDVLGYPGNYPKGGYDWDSYLKGDIELSPTVEEDLVQNLKPNIQKFLQLGLPTLLGALNTDEKKLNYINFYGNLLKEVDGQVSRILDVFEQPGGQQLRNDSMIIRTSDHGEMGLSHGGLRQKSFNAYEESIKVPLIWSNPVLFPEGKVSEELVSHVDLLPTITDYLGIKKDYNFDGNTYNAILKNPQAKGSQKYTFFQYDDYNNGQQMPGYDNAPPNGTGGNLFPNKVYAVRDKQTKYVLYYDGTGRLPIQEEFYDLRTAEQGGTDVDPKTGQPLEYINYSEWAESQRETPLITPFLERKRTELQKTLLGAIETKFEPSFKQYPAVPAESVQYNFYDIPNSTEKTLTVTYDSRWGQFYQVQYLDLDSDQWIDLGSPMAGNNGLLFKTDTVPSADNDIRIKFFKALVLSEDTTLHSPNGTTDLNNVPLYGLPTDPNAGTTVKAIGDTVVLVEGNITKGARFSLEDNSSVEVTGSVTQSTINGSNGNGNNSIDIAFSAFQSKFTTGDGNDRFNCPTFTSSLLDTGRGNDSVTIETFNDPLTLGGYSSKKDINFIDLSLNNDYLSGFGSARVRGGLGRDTLDLSQYSYGDFVMQKLTGIGNRVNFALLSEPEITMYTSQFEKFIFEDTVKNYHQL